jgi:hypothetical protein
MAHLIAMFEKLFAKKHMAQVAWHTSEHGMGTRWVQPLGWALPLNLNPQLKPFKRNFYELTFLRASFSTRLGQTKSLKIPHNCPNK